MAIPLWDVSGGNKISETIDIDGVHISTSREEVKGVWKSF